MTPNEQKSALRLLERTPNEQKSALRLLERLANPRGDWRDDETRRLARKLIKKIKNADKNKKRT